MPPLPTISQVWRCSLKWNPWGGVRPVNVFHVRCAGGTDADISSAIDHAFQHLVSGVRAGALIFTAMTSDQVLHDFDLLKLDGSSATTNHTLSANLFGATNGDTIPQACAVSSFHTAQRGARGRGRMYVGPIREATNAGGVLDSASVLNMANGWTGFMADLATATIPVQLVVASYAHADAHDVTTVRTDGIIGTQRRRVDQLR